MFGGSGTAEQSRCAKAIIFAQVPRSMTTTSRRIGYARVSTKDQKLAIQSTALEAAGCDQIFEDHGVSGATASRPGLDAALEALIAGDVLTVWKLDRLGRSVLHLSELLAKLERRGIHFHSLSEGIDTTTAGGRLVFNVFGAVAEFQREVIVENTMAGLAAARARGVKMGRPRALDDAAIREAHSYVMQGYPCSYVAKLIGIHRITLQRAFKRMGLHWQGEDSA